MRTREILERAGKTFIQAFGSYVLVDLSTVTSGTTDPQTMKTAILALLCGGIAAGASAAWNMLCAGSSKPEGGKEAEGE